MQITSVSNDGVAACHFAVSLPLVASSLASVALPAVVHGRDVEKTHHSLSDRVSLIMYQAQQAWACRTGAVTSRLSV